MRKRIFFILGVILLQACGTRPFVPEEYALDPGMIPAFTVNGQLTITNAQSSTAQVIVFNNGTSQLSSDLHTLTSRVVLQAIEELGKHGHVVNTAKTKTIDLKAISLLSDYKFFYWSSTMHLEATLGDGEVIELSNDHTSGWSLAQDLNGCIAESVMTLFKNDKVLAYLAQ